MSRQQGGDKKCVGGGVEMGRGKLKFKVAAGRWWL